jgi:hypothetical protein
MEAGCRSRATCDYSAARVPAANCHCSASKFAKLRADPLAQRHGICCRELRLELRACARSIRFRSYVHLLRQKKPPAVSRRGFLHLLDAEQSGSNEPSSSLQIHLAYSPGERKNSRVAGRDLNQGDARRTQLIFTSRSRQDADHSFHARTRKSGLRCWTRSRRESSRQFTHHDQVNSSSLLVEAAAPDSQA